MAIQMQTAFTVEIDEIDDALNEILAQIDLDSLKQNSLGIVSCYSDFLETGVYDALVEKLPFDLIGMSTMASASCKTYGQYRLDLSILTSDDVRFSPAVSVAFGTSDYQTKIEGTYKLARAKLANDPAMIVAFFPPRSGLSGSDMLTALDSASNATPIFGSLSSGVDMSYDGCRSFVNDQIIENGLAVVLIEGAIDPYFAVTHIPERNIREGRFIATDSEGCLVKTLNGIPAEEFLKDLGLILTDDNMTTAPFMVYADDAAQPTATGIYQMNPDGSLLFGVPIPAGTSMALGEIDQDGILSTGLDNINKLLDSKKINGVLVYPCVTRYIMLAPNQDSEMESIINIIDSKLPYSITYSGGEICPVKNSNGEWVNQFHNYSFPLWAF